MYTNVLLGHRFLILNNLPEEKKVLASTEQGGAATLMIVHVMPLRQWKIWK